MQCISSTIIYYRVTSKPTGPPRNRNFDDDYYESDYEDDSAFDDPELMVNQHLRNGNNLYVRPISMTTHRPTPPPRTERPTTRTSVSALRAPPNTRNTESRPSLPSYNNNRMPSIRSNFADSSRTSSEEDRYFSVHFFYLYF